MRELVDARRALAALAIVAVIVAAVPLSDMAARALRPDGGIGSADGIGAAGLMAQADAQAALERMEGLAEERNDALPELFEEEVGLLEGAHDVRVGASGNVVGYLVDGGADEAMRTLGEEMARRGWTEVPLGQGMSGATYVRDAGRCTWVLATCTQVGDEARMVVRGGFS